jgi:hypothetical protein
VPIGGPRAPCRETEDRDTEERADDRTDRVGEHVVERGVPRGQEQRLTGLDRRAQHQAGESARPPPPCAGERHDQQPERHEEHHVRRNPMSSTATP